MVYKVILKNSVKVNEMDRDKMAQKAPNTFDSKHYTIEVILMNAHKFE